MSAAPSAQVASVVKSLTTNGAINLYFAAEYGRLHEQTGVLCTGSGKWTTLAAIGVENHLKKLGLVEYRNSERGHSVRYWTSLGQEVARYLHANWSDHTGSFRDRSRQ